MKFLIMQFSPTSRDFISLRSTGIGARSIRVMRVEATTAPTQLAPSDDNIHRQVAFTLSIPPLS
jgi:hypothetical protein